MKLELYDLTGKKMEIILKKLKMRSSRSGIVKIGDLTIQTSMPLKTTIRRAEIINFLINFLLVIATLEFDSSKPPRKQWFVLKN
jgi:hypothetical protein